MYKVIYCDDEVEKVEEFKKTETFKMLIKGTYLGVMENDFKNMTKKQLVDWCFKRESEIFDLKQQLSLTEKALELACQTIKRMCPPLWIGGNVPPPEVKDAEYFIEKAKEEMKSE